MNIWIVDDEVNLANGLKEPLKRRLQCESCKNYIRTSATSWCGDPFSLIFLDQRLPDGNGIDILSSDPKQYPRAKGGS